MSGARGYDMVRSALRLLACVWLLISINALAREAVFVPHGEGRQELSDFMSVLQDTPGTLSVQEVASGQAGEFRPKAELESTGVTNDVFWARFQVDLRQYSEPYSFLLLEPQPIGRIDVFYPLEQGGFGTATIDAKQSLKERSLAVRNLLLRLPSPKVAPATIYVRFEQRAQPLQMKLTWVSSKIALEETAADHLKQGLIFGALFILVIHNVLVLLRTYDPAYLLYAYYLICFATLISLLTGSSAGILPFDATAGATIIVNAGVIHGGLGFFRTFLSLGTFAPRLNLFLKCVQGCAIALAVLALFGATRLAYIGSAALVPVAVSGILGSSFYRWRQGFKPAMFSVFGLAVHALVSTAYVLQLLKVVSGSSITIFWVELSAVWEALCFSFALADRLRTAEDEAKLRLAEQEKALAAEHEARAIAQSAAKEKNVFLSMISHELRTPIGCIVAELEAEERKSGGRERREGLKTIRWAVRYMESQIRDLFVLSIGDDDRLEMRPQPFEVGELVEDVLASVAETAKLKGLNVRMLSQHPMYVVADPRRVEQVLLNLVENAVKYTQVGEVVVGYELTEMSELKLVVRDTGAGIAKEHQDKLFLPYRRFGAIDRERNSFGIGLAVVQTLLRHLGGTVQVESDVGNGATFIVAIPVVIDGTGQEEHQEPCDEQSILIVDDRKEMLDSLAMTASSLGYRVDKASSAAVASNFLAANAYDLVLIDLDMPGKNGTELASETRRGAGPNAESRLIAISAGTPEAAGLDFGVSQWPFDGFLQKPIRAKDIRHAATSLVGVTDAPRANRS